MKRIALMSSLRPVINTRSLLVMFALSLTWFTLLSGFSFPVYLIPESGRTPGMSSVVPLVFIGATCVSIAILWAGGCASRRQSIEQKLFSQWAVILPAVVGLFGAICMALCAFYTGVAAFALAVVSAACLGFYGIATFAVWSAIARREFGEKAGAVLAFSYAACCLLGVVGCLLNVSAVVSSIAMPLIHGCLGVVYKKLPSFQQPTEGVVQCVDEARKPFFSNKTKLLIVENILFLLVTVVCMSVLDSVIFNMDNPVSTYSLERKAVIQVIGCLVFGFLACVLAVTQPNVTASIVAVTIISLLNVGGTLLAPNLLDSYPLFASIPASTGIAGFQALIMVLAFNGQASGGRLTLRTCAFFMAAAFCLPKVVALSLNFAFEAAGVVLARGDAFSLTKGAAFIMIVLTVAFLVGELCSSVSNSSASVASQTGDAEQHSADCDSSLPSVPSCLSEREMDVFQLLVAGYTTKAVGEKLFISKSTVETHAKRIYSKLDVHSKQELIEKYGMCIR